MAKDQLLDFDTLVQQQAQPTEQKIPQAELQPIVEEIPATAQVETPTQAIETVTPIVVDEETLNAELDLALGFIDFAQQAVLEMPVNSKRKKRLNSLLGENGVEKVELLVEKPIEELEPAEKASVTFEKQAQKVLAQLPFTESEKQQFKPLLLNYLRANRGSLPENFFVYIGILQAFGGRILNVLTL